MKFQEVCELDPSFKVILPKGLEVKIEGFTSFKLPKANNVIFIKNFNFFKLLCCAILNTSNNEWINTGVIFSESYLNEVKNQKEFEEISERVRFIGSVNDVDHSMSFWSKKLHDNYLANYNLVKDGRELESCDIGIDVSIAANTFIGDKCIIGDNVLIHAGSSIMAGSEIGNGCVIFPNVTIYPNVKIGKNVIIHAGVVIGSDGFGYNFINGVHEKVWHLGGVIVEDNVEIGSNTTIDAGTIYPTKIDSGVIIDNQVLIAHNCYVGKGAVICGQAGMAGSSSVLDYSILGGKVSINNDIIVGKQCKIAALSGVTRSWPDGSVIAGHPARLKKEWVKGTVRFWKDIKES